MREGKEDEDGEWEKGKEDEEWEKMEDEDEGRWKVRRWRKGGSGR